MRRMVVRARLAAALTLALIVLTGCGGVEFADLFLVTRTGSVPGAKLALLVNDGANVRCNQGAPRTLPGPLLLRARELQRQLAVPARKGLRLPARPQSILQYRIKSQDGTVSFADNSLGSPPVFPALELFTREVAKSVCGLAR